MHSIELGWYLPTHGDTTAFNDQASEVEPSLDLFERVVAAAENAGFSYLLIPVGAACWEAYVAGAYMAARSARIRTLIAARPGYINPVMLAKMISTLDQLSSGRISINLIAGQNEADVEAEGVTLGKIERYDLMEEEVRLLKALWTADGPVTFGGRFHKIKGAVIRPRPFQRPYPRFYLGGGSRQAWSPHCAGPVVRDDARASGRGYLHRRRSRAMRRCYPALHRRRMQLVLSFGLSA
jgi:alkanesulfonate monooxygenase